MPADRTIGKVPRLALRGKVRDLALRGKFQGLALRGKFQGPVLRGKFQGPVLRHDAAAAGPTRDGRAMAAAGPVFHVSLDGVRLTDAVPPAVLADPARDA